MLSITLTYIAIYSLFFTKLGQHLFLLFCKVLTFLSFYCSKIEL